MHALVLGLCAAVFSYSVSPSTDPGLTNDSINPRIRAHLLQERVDPAVVPLHAAERVEVPQHAADHAGDTRHRLEEDDAVEVHGLCWR